MSQLQQLEYVEKYFEGFDSEDLSTIEGVYTSVLAGKPVADPDAVLFSGGEAYRVNQGLDKNNDGNITAGEATASVVAVMIEESQVSA